MTEPEADLLSASRESLLATIKDLKQKLLSAEKSEEEYKTLLDEASRKLMESANMIVQVRDEAREATHGRARPVACALLGKVIVHDAALPLLVGRRLRRQQRVVRSAAWAVSARRCRS